MKKPAPFGSLKALLTVWLLVSPTTEAAAFELFGKCLFGTCKTADQDAQLIEPKRYSAALVVEGGKAVVDQEAIEDASELMRGREAAVAGSAGLIARAKGDYRRILAALYNQGHYAGTISILIEGREAADIKPGEELPDTSSVAITVQPGPDYIFGETKIINRAPPELLRFDQLPDDDPEFASGKTAKADAVRRAAIVARNEWRSIGYPKASIAGRDATANHPQRTLNVLLTMEPGPLATFGDISVDGTKRMDAGFVRYMTGLVPGQAYSPQELRKATARLDRLGVFGSRKIDESADVSADGQLPLTVVVSERKLRRIGAGATVSSTDGLGVEAYWLHRNLFGKAERLRLDAKFGGVETDFDADSFDYSLGATLVQPGILTPDTDLTWASAAKRETNDTYEETSLGGSAILTNYFSETITASAGLQSKYGEYRDSFGTRRFLTTGVSGTLNYDNRDSKVDPTTGFLLGVNALPFYEWEQGNAAAQVGLEGRTYLKLDKDGDSVVALRAKAGFLVGPSIDQIPPDLLFTAGGGNSVRGYGFKSIGLVDRNGDTSGGKSLFESSVEFRQKFTDTLGMVAFIDAGTVGGDSFVDFSEDLKVGAGVGIRYYTGLGPIRLDVALPLNPGSGDPDFAIYAGIGQAF